MDENEVEELVQFKVRMPKELHEWLKSQSESTRRTVTQEIVFWLERAKFDRMNRGCADGND